LNKIFRRERLRKKLHKVMKQPIDNASLFAGITLVTASRNPLI